MNYMNNTNADISGFHSVIVAAIKNNGQFDEDYADVFLLTKTPDGSAFAYALTFA